MAFSGRKWQVDVAEGQKSRKETLIGEEINKIDGHWF